MNQAETIKQKARHKFSWRLLGENFVFEEDGVFYKMPSFLAKNVMYKKTDSYEKIKTAHTIILKYF